MLFVFGEEGEVVVAERIATQAVSGEPCEGTAVPASRALNAAEDITLVLIVGDAEAGVERDVVAELTEQGGAECVDCAALDLGGGVAESSVEAMGDLVRGFVRESEGADAGRVDPELLDEVGDTLRETVRLAGAGAGEDKQGFGAAADGAAL